MAELWLPVEDRVAFWDAAIQQVRVTGWRPGPAGVSAIELVRGLWVVVDHASPTTLADLSVDLVDGAIDDAHLALLPALLGEEATDAVRRLLQRPPSARPTPLRSGSRRGEFDRAWTDDTTAHGAFARLAVAADLVDDAALGPAARAVAAVEAAVAAAELRVPGVERRAEHALELLVRSGGPGDLKARYRVAALVRAMAGTLGLGAIAAQARVAADDLVRADPVTLRSSSPPLAAAMAPAVPEPVEPLATSTRRRAPAAAPPPVPRERPIPVDGDRRGWAWLDAGGNVQVKAGPGAAGTWARVFRTSDRLLLGLAPLRPSPSDERELAAIVVIPPVPLDDLVVDITDEPSALRHAPAHELHRRAVLLGREAARLTRLGDHAADAAWQRCARAWEAVGDVQRANLSRLHGRRRDRAMSSLRRRADRPPRLIADEVD